MSYTAPSVRSQFWNPASPNGDAPYVFPQGTPTYFQQLNFLLSLQGKELEACYHYDHRHNRIDLIFTDGTHAKLTHRYPYWNERTMGPEPRVEMDDRLLRYLSSIAHGIVRQRYRDPGNKNPPAFTTPLRTASIQQSLYVEFELLPRDILRKRWPTDSEVHMVMAFQFGSMTGDGYVYARRENTSTRDTIVWEDVMIVEVARPAGTPNAGGMPNGGGMPSGEGLVNGVSESSRGSMSSGGHMSDIELVSNGEGSSNGGG